MFRINAIVKCSLALILPWDCLSHSLKLVISQSIVKANEQSSTHRPERSENQSSVFVHSDEEKTHGRVAGRSDRIGDDRVGWIPGLGSSRDIARDSDRDWKPLDDFLALHDGFI
jgi:hypothetical protein